MLLLENILREGKHKSYLRDVFMPGNNNTCNFVSKTNRCQS